jgi:hypothetical protein
VTPVPVITAEGWPVAASGVCGPLRGDTLHVDHHGRLTMCCLHSGIPSSGPDATVAGDASEGLTPALVSRLERIQAEAIAGRGTGPAGTGGWAGFECNACLAQHGRPHWTGEGTGGAPARRERWRGGVDRATPTRRILHVVQ